jgi:hypothetical protein
VGFSIMASVGFSIMASVGFSIMVSVGLTTAGAQAPKTNGKRISVREIQFNFISILL